jgi:hypothetical protein
MTHPCILLVVSLANASLNDSLNDSLLSVRTPRWDQRIRCSAAVDKRWHPDQRLSHHEVGRHHPESPIKPHFFADCA